MATIDERVWSITLVTLLSRFRHVTVVNAYTITDRLSESKIRFRSRREREADMRMSAARARLKKRERESEIEHAPK